MIVKCIRCNTEFSSNRTHSHVCPHCHFVFSEGDSGQAGFEVVRSSDLGEQPGGHRLLEEVEHKCAFHPDADAVDHCSYCGKPVCYVCAIETQDGFMCESCEAGPERPPGRELPKKPPDELRAKAQETETVSRAVAGGPYVAWEYRRRLGRLNALFTTWQHTLLNPLDFFRSMPVAGDFRSPLLYGLFWGLVAIAGGIMWKFLLYVYPLAMLFLGGEPIELSIQLSQRHILAAAALLLSPLFTLVTLTAACIIYHLFVVSFTRRHTSFEATVRVVCYSMGTNLFYFLPLLGGLAGEIWQLILVTLGLKEVYRISFPTALSIALGPYTLLLIPKVAFMLWAVSGSGLGAENFLANLISSLFA